MQYLKYANITLHPPFSNFFILKLITASPKGLSATTAFEKSQITGMITFMQEQLQKLTLILLGLFRMASGQMLGNGTSRMSST